METGDLQKVLTILRKERPGWQAPVDEAFRPGTACTPFAALVSCLLSLRTRDQVSGPVARKLLQAAPTPKDLLTFDQEELAALIKPVGFYRQKAGQLLAIAHQLMEHHGGAVPAEMDRLLQLPGVGRKTANLTLCRGFGIPAIPVDTHVHRISNRWGYVNGAKPDHTESLLRKKLPPSEWADFNALLVAFGQTICRPVGPRCHLCPVANFCISRRII